MLHQRGKVHMHIDMSGDDLGGWEFVFICSWTISGVLMIPRRCSHGKNLNVFFFLSFFGYLSSNMPKWIGRAGVLYFAWGYKRLKAQWRNLLVLKGQCHVSFSAEAKNLENYFDNDADSDVLFTKNILEIKPQSSFTNWHLWRISSSHWFSFQEGEGDPMAQFHSGFCLVYMVGEEFMHFHR